MSTVLSGPEPPMTILAFGTSEELADVAEMFKPLSLPASPMEKEDEKTVSSFTLGDPKQQLAGSAEVIGRLNIPWLRLVNVPAPVVAFAAARIIYMMLPDGTAESV